MSFANMLENGHLATVDPLGIGGLLIDALRLDQVMRQGIVSGDELFRAVLTAALDP